MSWRDMAARTELGVPVSTLCPKFLHTNSTSHTWPFSAIAELIDNAYDPDVSADHFWIDKTVVQEKDCLIFMDDGNGLDHDKMLKMLSFGYSDKIPSNAREPIGIYGNGFKSGSMRLGKDAIVFSKSQSSTCVGMLSQTYLKEIEAQQIIVPIVCFEQTETTELSVREEHEASLQHILLYSPFKTQKELLVEINAITSSSSTKKTGTRIIIWNLRRTSTGTTEFDFETQRYDIRIPSDVFETMNETPSPRDTSYIPECAHSLRAYCSILYLTPRMHVIIRGQKVKSELIAKSLAHTRKDRYKPNFLTRAIPITFGYNTKSKDQYGIMMYHKNRLIKAYERVGCQLKANNKGVGVIGIIECNFLDPTHNKQSFNETDKYRKTMNSLGTKLEEYWQEIRYKFKTEDPNCIPVEDTKKQPDQNWVQCDECLRWRKLPDGIDCNKLPEKWYCRMNPDPQYRSCQVDQEPVDSDDDQRSYPKTYKQQERQQKKHQERKRQKAEEVRNHQEEQQHQTMDRPPSATLRSRFNTESQQGGAVRAGSSLLRSPTISQAACSPSSSSSLPVISKVFSLSPGPLSRMKRAQPVTPQRTPKRPRLNARREISEAFTAVRVGPVSSSSEPVYDGDIDDDIVILETASTPKPVKPGFNLTKVKTEHEQSDANISMLTECSDVPDVATETNAAGTGSAGSAAVGTSSSPERSPETASSTTQTEGPKVKIETEDQNHAEEEDRAGQSTSYECGSGGDNGFSSLTKSAFKQESSEEDHSEGQRNETLQDKETHHRDHEDDAEPSCAHACDKEHCALQYHNMTDVQKQQDQLLELMQATAQERDMFKEQVHGLTGQLQDLKSRLQELSAVSVKECSHQASQTEETDEWRDNKTLFEKAKQKINELVMEKEALLEIIETKPNIVQTEGNTDEIALQVDHLMRELDERNKERDELRSQLDGLEEEKANLAARCEELKLNLQQKENAQEEEARTADSSTDPSSDASRSLIALRHNIGRLLISYVPALDLEQVNYECNVIDEILEQVVSDQDLVQRMK